MKKLKPLGQLALSVAVGVAVGVAGTIVLKPSQKLGTMDKTILWEGLEGEEGSDLQRLWTPDGWLIENSDGYLVIVADPEHGWLESE